MTMKRRAYLRLAWAAAFFCLAFVPSLSEAREITDMAGRRVDVPDKIDRIYAMTHSFPLIAAIAPDLLAGMGWPMPPSRDVMRFLPRGLEGLPLLGTGTDASLEKMKAVGVDVAFGWPAATEMFPVKQFARIGIPVVFLDVDRLDRYPDTFRFLGKLLHREARGERLAKKLEETVAAVRRTTAGIPAAERVRVYYAESVDGLTSQCDASPRSEVIALAGGLNALHCDKKSLLADHYPVDIETVLRLDPDVVVTRFAKTAEAIRGDPRWQHVKAVRLGRVYAAPGLPFNWIDRPPSYMRAMGALWLAEKLYPGRVRFDLKRETRDFYQEFFGYDLSDADFGKLFVQ
jgi:iron complex transport system substrate-binding protein